MKVYTTDKIRNVVLLGHGGAGKTTLAEAMCHLTGVTSRMGKVEDGNSISDYTKEEQKRGFSIKASLIPVEWKNCKINILDTPGYFDFVGEVEEAISVADAAIIVVSGKAGVEVGALLDNGVDVVLKYFALNDCEQNRLGQAAWLTEQAAREIYLKAFQKALEENGGRGGVMTAYTRWGTTWSGMNQNLMTNIMRGEWGNVSMHITDNILVSYCNGADAVLAGGVTCFDAMLPYAVNALKAEMDDPVIVNAMVEAMHHNLYTIINSAAMNGVGADTVVRTVSPKIVSTVKTAFIVCALLLVVSIVFLVIKRRKFVKTEEYISYKAFKKAPKTTKTEI